MIFIPGMLHSDPRSRVRLLLFVAPHVGRTEFFKEQITHYGEYSNFGESSDSSPC